jgi:hypothetical protein
MKRQILIYFMLFCSLNLFAQKQSEPFRKANTIIIETQQPDSANFINFQRQLMKYDYFIESANKELKVIETKYHELKKRPGWSHSYSFRIIMIDGKIIIKPFWKLGVTSFGSVRMTDQSIRWHYATSRGNIQNMIYNDIMELISDYPHTNIIYSKE